MIDEVVQYKTLSNKHCWQKTRLLAMPFWTLRYFIAPVLAYASAGAQDYPAKTVRLIVAVAPGGGTDILGRQLARKLGEQLGQQVIVDNKPGGGTVIGTDFVAKSASDGYTLLMQVNALAANHTLFGKLPYDTLRDFAPVVFIALTPNVLVIHPSLPVKTVKAFVALARSKPGAIAYASSGQGGAAFLATEMLKLKTGISMLHVPYKGTIPALTAMLAGEAQCMVASLPGTIPYIRSNRVRALAVTSAQRAAATMEIPTMLEGGITDFEFVTWYGMFAPRRTPREVIAKLNATVNGILQQQEFRAQLARDGLEPTGGTQEAFDDYFRKEVGKLRVVIRASGAKAE
jgi:tripartite-type tricarboxylate transporter receptor subunit TctC